MIANPLRPAARGLPLGRNDALWWMTPVVALIVYVAALAGIALVAVDDALGAAEDSVATRLTVQVPADASNARLQTVVAALRQTPGVRAATVLTPAETARLLEPWLGAPVPADELPVPRLIDVEIERGAAVDLAALRQQVAAIVPGARVDGHEAWLDHRRAAAWRLRGVLAAAIVAALLALLLLALYTTRAALAARRSDIELFHRLGAVDADIARPFAIRAAALALLGGAIGALAVLPTAAALGGADGLPGLPVAAGGTGLGDWRLWAILGAAVAGAAVIATAGALAAARRRLRRLS
jgi:cell division transport system permease protein